MNLRFFDSSNHHEENNDDMQDFYANYAKAILARNKRNIETKTSDILSELVAALLEDAEQGDEEAAELIKDIYTAGLIKPICNL